MRKLISNLKSLVLITAGLLCLVGSAVGCSTASAQSDGTQPKAKEGASANNPISLLEYDFTGDINDQVLVDRRGASKQSDALIGIKAIAAKSKHPKDEIILGRKLLAGNNWWTITSTTALIAKYIAENGDVPQSGADLFSELQKEAAYGEFIGMIPTHRMIKFGPAINMATNRFYQTFSNAEWHAGGIYVEILAPLGGGSFRQGTETIHFGSENDPESPDIACYYKVFSGAEGEVLFDDFLTIESACEGQQTAGLN